MEAKKTEYTQEDLIVKMIQLETEKKDAIKNQQYELASNIRDQIRKYNELLEDLIN